MFVDKSVHAALSRVQSHANCGIMITISISDSTQKIPSGGKHETNYDPIFVTFDHLLKRGICTRRINRRWGSAAEADRPQESQYRQQVPPLTWCLLDWFEVCFLRLGLVFFSAMGLWVKDMSSIKSYVFVFIWKLQRVNDCTYVSFIDCSWVGYVARKFRRWSAGQRSIGVKLRAKILYMWCS